MIAVKTGSSLQTKADKVTVADLDYNIDEIENEVIADRIIWRMQELQEKIDAHEETKRIAKEFYEAKQDKLQEQIEHLESKLKQYMDAREVKTLATPNGTVRTMRRTRHIWSDIAEIDMIEFCQDNKIPLRIKHSEEIDKKAVIKYIESTGDYPAGYRSEISRSFSCTYNRQQKRSENDD